MADFRWGYFLKREELISTYCSAGGEIGTFNVKDPNDLQHARRAIAECLMPGPFCVWYASLDEDDGKMFFVGKPDQLDLREAVDVELATRCYVLFHRSPDPCERVENSYGYEYDLIEKHTGKSHTLTLLEVLQSSRFGDHYPLREYEIPPHQRHLMKKVPRPL